MITRIPDNTWASRLAPPAPIIKKLNGNAYNGYFFPAPVNDGSYITLPSSYIGTLSFFDASATLVWSVAFADIDATCDYWTGTFWLDTVDNAIWVWAYDTGVSPNTYFLAKVDLTAGTVTNIGSCTPGDGLFGYTNRFYVKRASIGSGDLTIRYGSQRIVLSTADGSIVTAAASVTQNGVTISGDSSYETADGAIYTAAFPQINTTTGTNEGRLQRGGQLLYVTVPENSPSCALPYLWDGYIVIGDVLTATIARNRRFFNRSDFDAWLVRIADYYGLPV